MSAPTTNPAPVPTEEVAAVTTNVEATATESDEQDVPVESTAAPYALVFHEGQRWSYNVQADGLIAMSGSQHGVPSSVECRVEKVDYFCDRKISTVTCDGANKVMAGVYTTTGRGIWKASWNGASEQLEDKTRLFARYPESLVDGRGVPLARPYHGGWCTTTTTNGQSETICVNADRGLTGGSIASANTKVFVGDVPRS
jgi:hypothetical protein